MYFIVDEKNNVIFGWSAKCGCNHIKNIIHFLQTNNLENKIHLKSDYSKLPANIEKYTTILFIRNPYKRIVSGFLEKYNKNGQYRKLWKYDSLTFSKFIEELIKNEWRMIERHHFTQQTSELFDKNKIIKSKQLVLNDIENIDYKYIENIYNKEIPEVLLNFKGVHIRKKYDEDFNENVWDLDMNVYFNYNVSIKYFYSEEIKEKVYNFYRNDFFFFKEYGFDYENTIF